MSERSAARIGAEVGRCLSAARRIENVVWLGGSAVMLPLHVEMRRDVVRKPLEDSKHIDIVVDSDPRVIPGL